MYANEDGMGFFCTNPYCGSVVACSVNPSDLKECFQVCNMEDAVSSMTLAL